ncbi:MAG: outer membrane beta-barrel protein [Bacteroidia bacterium]|nr:outer membrane beta-barrel protein [Bacteroidia bacterium]
MKKLIFVITILFSFFRLNAQKWEISPKIRPNIIFINSKSIDFTKDRTSFGTSVSVSLEYLINKKIDIGIEPEYSYLYRIFETPWYITRIPEHIMYKINKIESHELLIPLFFKLYISKFYINSGYGISYFLHTKYRIEGVSSNMNIPDKVYTNLLYQGEIKLRTNRNSPIGQYFSFGIGRYFDLKNIMFLIELKYSQDITGWSYKPETDQDIDEIVFKTHILSLSVGIRFPKFK